MRYILPILFVDNAMFAHNGLYGAGNTSMAYYSPDWQHEFDTVAYSQTVSPGGSTRVGRTGPGWCLMSTTALFNSKLVKSDLLVRMVCI